MQGEQTVLDRIQRRQLKWHGHILRMEDSGQSGRMRRGRPQQSWRNQVTKFMKSRNMEEDMAEDRRLWRLGVDGWLLAYSFLPEIIFPSH